jgi:hypothetical protein
MRFIWILCMWFVSQQALGQQNEQLKPFLPELLGQYPNVHDFTISSQEDEAYFTLQSHQGEVSVIAYIKKQLKWEEPHIAPFSGKYHDLEPFLSPDELTLYFASNRPIDSSTDTPKDYDIWYVQRKSIESAWSNPINMGKPVNTENNEFYPAVSNNRNLYFTSDGPNTKGADDIFMSEWQNNHYLPPISLSGSINTEGHEFNAYISPDESFILFSGYNREGGFGSGDLYICFRSENGNWSRAKNLGPDINSIKMDYCPFVNIKSNDLYFTSRRTLFSKGNFEFYSMPDLLEEIEKHENGLSRVYKVSIDQIINPKK